VNLLITAKLILKNQQEYYNHLIHVDRPIIDILEGP